MKTAMSVLKALESFNEQLGKFLAWGILFVVLITFTVAVLRYGFRVGWTGLQEIYLWTHAMVFMGAMGYTLLHDNHVRVDLFYRPASLRYKAWVNLLGTIFFLFPSLAVFLWACYPYVAISWQRLEGSPHAGGLPGLFVLKSFLLIFVVVVAAQGIALIIRNYLILRGELRFAAPYGQQET